jgi:hypothetical protein
MSRLPAAFRSPALASRVILFPPGNWAFLTVGLPRTTRCPDPDGVTTFRACEIRPGWVPPLPRGRRCSPQPDAVPGRRLPLPSGQSLRPATTPTSEAPIYEASTRVHAIPRPACLTCGPPDGTAGPWAFPCAPHPAVTGSARQGGAGR